MDPISNSIEAKAHSPQYKVHKYFARRPYNVFENLISHYSKPGDIILDCFCGGGVTIAESLKLDRKVIGVDLNPISTFITEMQIQQADITEFTAFVERFLDECETKYSSLYTLKFKGVTCKVVWTEYAYTVKCPSCGTVNTLSDEFKIRNGSYRCINQGCSTNASNTTIGFKRTKALPEGSTPLRVKVLLQDQYMILEVDDELKTQIFEQQKHDNKDLELDTEIPRNWDRTLEDCLYEKGVDKFSSLFTNKNLFVNLSIFRDIQSLKTTSSENYVDLLYFAFSASLRYTNKMSRVTSNWENGNPTCMDKHAYWLPNVYVETNILDYLKNRINALLKNIEYNNCIFNSKKTKSTNFVDLMHNGDYLILNQSSSKISAPDKSVSLVLTDPPYGSNVQYAELSSYWNIWLKKYKGLSDYIYNSEEAITHRKKKSAGFKSLKHYETILLEIYTECNRLLKDDGYLVFTFNNKDINVWIALLSSIAKAGFYLPTNGVIFQDFIESYKNTSHLRFEGNIIGDFIYSFKKRTNQEIPSNFAGHDLFDTVSKNIQETLENVSAVGNRLTNTELYTIIFTKLINVILDYVLSNSDMCVIESAEKAFNNQFIDSAIAKYLVFHDGLWSSK